MKKIFEIDLSKEIKIGVGKFKVKVASATPKELPWLKLTKSKVLILKTLKENPSSIYSLAKMLKKDYKNIYNELKELKKMGLIELKEERRKKIPVLIVDSIVYQIKL